MQAEGIRKGDRYDTLDGRGRVNGGWTARCDAVVASGKVYVPVTFHDGSNDTNVYAIGEQVPLTWGAGGDMQRTVKFPPGSPEYEAYAAELRTELAKFAAGEPPYDGDQTDRERQIGRLKP